MRVGRVYAITVVGITQRACGEQASCPPEQWSANSRPHVDGAIGGGINGGIIGGEIIGGESGGEGGAIGAWATTVANRKKYSFSATASPICPAPAMPSTMDFRFLSAKVSIKRRKLSMMKSAPNAPPTSTIGHRTASSGTTHATEIGRNVASE